MNPSDLKKPFDPKRISWRVGSTTADKRRGMALAYCDSRDVQDRLDEVCGPEGWQCRYALLGKTTICEIGIKIGDEWVWKADGAGDTDFEAEKGALSDAFKRSAVKWGIGRYLYDVDAPWVEIEPAGKSFKIKDGEKSKLYACLGGQAPQKPAPAPSSPSDAPEQPPQNPPAGGAPKVSPRDWALEQIAFIRKASYTEIQAWDTRTYKAMGVLKSEQPDLHADIMDTRKMRIEAVKTP